MRRFAPGLLVLASVVFSVALTAGPAIAVDTHTVTIANYAFTPQKVRVSFGDTVDWHNNDAATHNSKQNQGLWKTGYIVQGADATVIPGWSGAFAYHCTLHTDMKGSVRVPIHMSPLSGDSTTTFTITFADAPMPTGFTATVQERVGSGSWTDYATGLAGPSTTFQTSTPGTYSFRSLLVSATSQTGASPLKTITVS